jgi:hypothetical protein
MALTNCISHNVFHTIAYTKKNGLELSNFFDRNILKTLMSLMSVGIGVVIYLQH